MMAKLILLCRSFVFPLGSLVLRATNSVRAHWAVQAFGSLMVVVGFACAMVISFEYNRVSLVFTHSNQSLISNRASISAPPTKSSASSSSLP